jgi:hypothetical protein
MKAPIFQYIFALSVLMFGLHFFAYGMIGYDYAYLPGDLGDTRLNNYFLEHGYKSLFLNQVVLWDAPFMYPQKNVLALSDNLLGTMPIYAFWRWIGADRETALQLWYIGLFVLNFLGCFWMSVKLDNKIYISALVAYVYAFALPVIAQANHIQLMPRFIFPIIFYHLVKFLSTFQLKYFLFLLLCITYQIYCGIYLGFLSIYCIIVFILVMVIQQKLYLAFFNFIKAHHYKVILIIIINFGLLYPLMVHYVAAKNLVGMRSYDFIVDGMPRFSSYLYAYTSNYVWSFLTHTGSYLSLNWEHFLFPGGSVLFCLGLILSARFLNKTSYYNSLYLNIAYTIIIVVFTTTVIYKDFSVFEFTRNVLPGFSAMKGITRIIFPLLLLFSLCLVPFFNFIEKNKSHLLLISIFSIFILSEQLVQEGAFLRIKKSIIYNRQNALLNKIDNLALSKNSVLAYMPLQFDNAEAIQADAMMVAQLLNIKTVNGYSSSAPPGFSPFWSKPDSVNLQLWFNSKNANNENIIEIK